MLTLPYVCKLCGLGLGVIMLALGYMATLWSFNLLIKANERTGGHKTYKDFCSACGGRKLFLGYDTVAIFTIFGSLIGYQVISILVIASRYRIVSNMIQGVMKDFGVMDYASYKPYHIMVVSALIIFPVCMVRSVNSFRYATLISIGAVLYTCMVLLAELFFYWDTEKARQQIVWFKFDANFFSAFGITFFAFYCQVGFFPALENLLKLDKNHIKKVSFRLPDNKISSSTEA